MNKETPKDLEQINKNLGFHLPPNANQANYEKWLSKVKLVIESDGIIVVRRSDGQKESSKVKCESVSFNE